MLMLNISCYLPYLHWVLFTALELCNYHLTLIIFLTTPPSSVPLSLFYKLAELGPITE